MKSRIRRTRPGDEIKRKATDGRDEENGTITYRMEYWTVKKIYPFHVLAERHGIRECFNIGWLITNGYEA